MFHFTLRNHPGPQLTTIESPHPSPQNAAPSADLMHLQRRGSSTMHHTAVSPRLYHQLGRPPTHTSMTSRMPTVTAATATSTTTTKRATAPTTATTNISTGTPPSMYRAMSADTPRDGSVLETTVYRTGSGGLMYRRPDANDSYHHPGDFKRSSSSGSSSSVSSSRQEEISRAKAAELSALYEWSDDKDCTLNRSASFPSRLGTPTLGGASIVMMTPQQAKAKFDQQHQQQQQEKQTGTVVDPLLTPHERDERYRSVQSSSSSSSSTSITNVPKLPQRKTMRMAANEKTPTSTMAPTNKSPLRSARSSTPGSNTVLAPKASHEAFSSKPEDVSVMTGRDAMNIGMASQTKKKMAGRGGYHATNGILV